MVNTRRRVSRSFPGGFGPCAGFRIRAQAHPFKIIRQSSGKVIHGAEERIGCGYLYPVPSGWGLFISIVFGKSTPRGAFIQYTVYRIMIGWMVVRLTGPLLVHLFCSKEVSAPEPSRTQPKPPAKPPDPIPPEPDPGATPSRSPPPRSGSETRITRRINPPHSGLRGDGDGCPAGSRSRPRKSPPGCPGWSR